MKRSSPRRKSLSPKRNSPKRKSLSPKRKSPEREIPFAHNNNEAREFMRENREFRLAENITKLDLSKLELTQIPLWVFNFIQLEELNLFANKLASIPLEIGNLTHLKGLYFTYNHLTSLPSTIGKLTQLQELDLTGNELALLPSEIGRLPHLREIFLDGNPLKRLPYTLRVEQISDLPTKKILSLQRREINEKISKLTPLVESGTLHPHNQRDIRKLLRRQNYRKNDNL